MKKGIIFLIVVFIIYVISYDIPTTKLDTGSYSHRALVFNNDIENSKTAILNSLDIKRGIELDLRLTKDNEIVIFHDKTLNRIFNIEGYISSLSLKELQDLSYTNGDKILTLSEALKLIDGEVPLLLDIKGDLFGDNLELLVKYNLDTYDGVVDYITFNPITAYNLKKFNLKGKVGINSVGTPILNYSSQKLKLALFDLFIDFDFGNMKGVHWGVTDNIYEEVFTDVKSITPPKMLTHFSGRVRRMGIST